MQQKRKNWLNILFLSLTPVIGVFGTAATAGTAGAATANATATASMVANLPARGTAILDDIARGAESEFEHEGTRFHTHVYEVDGHVIWGATARIVNQFLGLLGGDAA